MKEEILRLAKCVDEHREEIADCVSYIWKNPEVGYKEWKTTAYLEEQFERYGYTVKRAGDGEIPGFTAEIDTGRPGPTIGIMGELDSLICATHPDADPETKAVHACGHCCQTTMVLGCAMVFADKKNLEGMCGKIRFICVPAEETIDLEYRNSLVEQGVIKYVAGKIEFMSRGMFDGVDMAMLIHTAPDEDKEHLFCVTEGENGCITKHFEYLGVAAHAGSTPHLGVNALYAAALGLMACNSLRETFQEKDFVRVHPIITQAGVAANAIPNVAKMDTYVRASTADVMIETNKKVNRALASAASAMGANLLIQDSPGNMPFHTDPYLNQVFRDAVSDIFGNGKIIEAGWSAGSSDLGDISCIMPVIQPYAYGISGKKHGEDYKINDVEKACINPTKALVGTAYRLLANDAEIANRVIENFVPVYESKEEYFKVINSIKMNKTVVQYTEDGKVVLDFTN